MNIDIVRGSTHNYFYTVTKDGQPFDLTGAAISFMVKERVSDADEIALFTKTLGDGVTMADPTSGTFEVLLSAIDTRDLPQRIVFFECAIERNAEVLRQGVNQFTIFDNVVHETIV